MLLARALEGVKVRVLVWRHALFSILERVFPSGSVPLLREATRLKLRAARLGLNVQVLHGNLPNDTSPYAHPFADNDARTHASGVLCALVLLVCCTLRRCCALYAVCGCVASAYLRCLPDIVLIIVGNPKGLISSHHEKLLLADADCPAHTIACTGVRPFAESVSPCLCLFLCVGVCVSHNRLTADLGLRHCTRPVRHSGAQSCGGRPARCRRRPQTEGGARGACDLCAEE